LPDRIGTKVLGALVVGRKAARTHAFLRAFRLECQNSVDAERAAALCPLQTVIELSVQVADHPAGSAL